MTKLTPERDDIQRDGGAPKAVRRFLLQLGGTNPYGEPNIRIAKADHIMIYRGNCWEDRPKGTKLEDQGGIEFSPETKLIKVPNRDGKFTQLMEIPKEMQVKKDPLIRKVKEMRWITRYPGLTGWMLQHWDAPHNYGSRVWWEAQKVAGTDLQCLGPFPEKGAYEPFIVWVDFSRGKLAITNLTSPEIMPFSKMEDAYGQWMQHRNELQSGNKDWRMLNRMIEFQRQQEAKERKEDEERQAFFRDKISPIFASSLEAGRIREQLAQRCRARGIKMGHVGA